MHVLYVLPRDGVDRALDTDCGVGFFLGGMAPKTDSREGCCTSILMVARLTSRSFGLQPMMRL